MYYSSRFSAWFIIVMLVFLALSFNGNLFAEESNPAFLITVESLSVRPGEPIIVEFTSGPGNSKDWIGLYKSNAPDRDYLEWQYLDGLSQGSLTFKPVDEEGEFQFRGFANDGMTLLGKSDIFEVKKISVQVTGWETKTVGNVTFSIPQNWQTTPPDEEIVGWQQGDPSDPDVAFGIVTTDNLEDQLGYITITQEGEKTINELSFRFIEGSVEDTDIKVWLFISKTPLISGKVFGFLAGSRDFLWSEAEPVFNQILQSIKITLPENVVSIIPPSQLVPPQTDFSIEFSGGPGNPKDWIGLYKTTSSDRDYLTWKYLDGKTTGQVTFTAPEEEGEYDIRIFENDGMKRLAKSSVFQVQKSTIQPGFHLDKDTYLPNEEIKVQFTAPAQLDSTAWVGIIPSNVPHGDETVNDQNDVTYQYLSGRTEGQLVFSAPADPGDYDFRMNDTDSGGKEIATVSFTVVFSQPNLSLNATEFLPGETITVHFASSPGNQKDWVGLYKKGAVDRDYLTWKYTEGNKDGSLSFEAPGEPGEYDARLFENDGYTRQGISETFTVIGKEIPPPPSSTPITGGGESDTGLVLYLPFDVDTQDKSGSGNNGIASSTTIVPGKIGQTFDFNGKDSSVATPLDINPEKLPEISVSCWVYPRAVGGRRQVWSQDDGGYDRSLLAENDGWNVFTGGANWNTGYKVDLNTWQFLVVVFTKTDVLFYKNGDKKSLGTPGGSGMLSGYLFTLGDNPSEAYTEYFDGLIDEVRVYDRALSDEEVKTLYGSSSAQNQNSETTLAEVKEWVSTQIGNLLFDAPSGWNSMKTDTMNLGGWYVGDDSNFPDYAIALVKVSSLDSLKEGLIIDQEKALSIDGNAIQMIEGHYVHNKVRARFYVIEGESAGQEKLVFVAAAKDILWKTFVPIEERFISSLHFGDDTKK